LKALLDLPVEIPERAVVARAAELYLEGRAGWLDCYLGAYALALGEGKVLSFDGDLGRLTGVSGVAP